MTVRSNDIDEKLASASQQTMSQLVHSLPDDQPSMQWRSELNERLLVVAKKKKRWAFTAVWLRPAVGLSVASALALLLVMELPGTKPNLPRPPVETALLVAHDEAFKYSDVSGIGLTPHEVHAQPAVAEGTPVQWSESDIEGL